MTDTSGLGDRMKAYEAITRTVLPHRTYTIVRVDGRAFHTLLKTARWPFDDNVIAAMDAAAAALCDQMSGAVFAYCQSDEVSVLLTDFHAPETQPWFGGVTQKIVSVAASIATVAFNNAYTSSRAATFDARVFTLPSPDEVAAYFLWRQRDAVRNSISMTARAHFSHRRLHRVTAEQMQEMLHREHDVDWSAYPDAYKRGRVIVRQSGERPVNYFDRRAGRHVSTVAVRTWWERQPAPHFTTEPSGFLAGVIPTIPTIEARSAR